MLCQVSVVLFFAYTIDRGRVNKAFAVQRLFISEALLKYKTESDFS